LIGNISRWDWRGFGNIQLISFHFCSLTQIEVFLAHSKFSPTNNLISNQDNFEEKLNLHQMRVFEPFNTNLFILMREIISQKLRNNERMQNWNEGVGRGVD